MNESEIHLVNEVYNNTYGNIRPDENFIWEFIHSPWGKAIYVIAEDLDKTGNKIVGTQCAIPILLINGLNENILTAKSEDTFVHPEYRGQKLFDRMYEVLFNECMKQEIKYIWGFTYARKPFEKIGFAIPFDTIQGVAAISAFEAARILASFNPINRIIEKMKIYIGSIYSFFIFLIKNIITNKINIRIDKNFILIQNSIYNLLKQEEKLWSIDNSEQYINWRIIDNPYKNDFIETIVDYKDQKARIIFNCKSNGLAYIEEMIFESNISDIDKIKFIKNSIKQLKKTKKIKLIRFWGFQTNPINQKEITLLKKSGFIFINRGTSFVWKALFEDNKIEIFPEQLFLSRLYTQGNR